MIPTPPGIMEKKLAQIFMLGHGLLTGTTPMLSSLSPYSSKTCGPTRALTLTLHAEFSISNSLLQP